MNPTPGQPARGVEFAGQDFPILTLVGISWRTIESIETSLKTALKIISPVSTLELAGRRAAAYATGIFEPDTRGALFPEADQLRMDVLEKRASIRSTRGAVLALLFAAVTGAAFGQDTLALSSGTAVQGGAIALNLSLTSPAGSTPAGLQWTLTYAAGNVASIGVVAGASAAAANKTPTCFSSAGSYTCLLTGMSDAVIQNGVVAVINVTMTSSAITTPVGITNLAGAAPGGGPISVTGTGGTITVPAPPPSPVLTGLSCNFASLTSGGSSTCAAALNEAAPAGGATIALSSSTSALSVPGSVTVASGATSANFTATAGTFTTSQTAVVTASYGGSSQTASILLVAPTVVSLVSCSPTSLSSGGTSACSVTLSQAAGSSGIAVSLSSNNSALNVPASVTVASGATSANFTATAGTFTTSQTAVVTASYGGSSQTASILLVAPTVVSLVSCSPTSLSSGGTSACSVTLSQAAGSGGIAVSLSSNNAALTVPASVTVAWGATSANFTATAGTIHHQSDGGGDGIL